MDKTARELAKEIEVVLVAGREMIEELNLTRFEIAFIMATMLDMLMDITDEALLQ